MNKANCKSCNAPMVYLTLKPTFRNPTPKANPINPEPDKEKGNLLVNWETGYYQVLKPEEIEKVKRLPKPPELYSSHFSICPDSKKFRRK